VKKTISLFILLALLFALCSCSAANSSGITSYTAEDGSTVYESDNGTRFHCKSLPYDIPYNDTVVTLESIDYYEDSEDYSHNLYCVITLDVGALDDSQLHWLVESDLSITGVLSHEKNGYENYIRNTDITETYELIGGAPKDTFMSFKQTAIGKENKIICLFTSDFSEENRYSFSGAEFSVSIDIDQDETYVYTSDDGETSNLHKSCQLYYPSVVPDEITEFSMINRQSRALSSAVLELLGNHK